MKIRTQNIAIPKGFTLFVVGCAMNPYNFYALKIVNRLFLVIKGF